MFTEEGRVFKAWMVLEIMGHRKVAGLVTEEERFGAVMCRVDIPNNAREYTTQYYHASSVFCATPINETDARKLARHWRPEPFGKYDLQREEETPIPY